MGWRKKLKDSATKATQTTVKTANRHKQMSVNGKRSCGGGSMRGWQSWWWTCCYVASLRGKHFGQLRRAGRHVDHSLAKISGTLAAFQGVNDCLCWRHTESASQVRMVHLTSDICIDRQWSNEKECISERRQH